MCRSRVIFVAAVQLLAIGTSNCADVPSTSATETLSRVIVTGQAEPESLTSPSAGKAEEQKREGQNRIAGVPIHLYEAELIYATATGFYAGPNVQWNVTRYAAD